MAKNSCLILDSLVNKRIILVVKEFPGIESYWVIKQVDDDWIMLENDDNDCDITVLNLSRILSIRPIAKEKENNE